MTITLYKNGLKIGLTIYSNYKIDVEKVLPSFKIIPNSKSDFNVFFIDKSIDLPNAKKEDIILLNQDIKYNLTPIKANIITYGIDNKASVTTSSINSLKEEEAFICVQRGFENIFGEVIEPMELKFKNNKYNIKNISTLIGIFALKILCDC